MYTVKVEIRTTASYEPATTTTQNSANDILESPHISNHGSGTMAARVSRPPLRSVVLLPVTESWCCTKVNVTKVNYRWTIHEFRLYQEKLADVLISSTFSAGANENLKWRLRLHTRGMGNESKQHLSLYLIPVFSRKSEVRATVKFSIINAKGEEVNVTEIQKAHIFTKECEWGVEKFISRDRLFDEANGMLPDNKLTIYCELGVFVDSVNISGQLNGVHLNVPECHLSHDLGKLFDSEQFSDVTLSVSGRNFQAHKAILAARSSVFDAMFVHDMQERKLNRVEITDVDPEVLREMLRFIYSGKTENLEEMADQLLAASTKYALDRLKALCEKALCGNLSTENAADILILADLHSAGQLKEYAIHFINTHVTDVVETDGWKSMIKSHPHLIADTMCALANQPVAQSEPPAKQAKQS